MARSAIHLTTTKRPEPEDDDVIDAEIEDGDDPEQIGLLEDGGAGVEVRPSQTCTIPLWKAKWSQERLLAHWKTLTDNAIARGFRQIPVSDSDLMFKERWVKEACDKNFVIQDIVDKDSAFWKMRRYAGCDIAAGESATSAYWVLITIAIDPKTRHRYVLDIRRYKGLTLNRQFGLIKEVYDRMFFEVVGVENNGVQKAIQRHYAEGKVIPTKPIYTGATQKRDEELGIPAMAGEFEHGQWHIPYGNARSVRLMEPFIEELKAYPTGSFTDTVMAAFFAREMSILAPRSNAIVDVVTY